MKKKRARKRIDLKGKAMERKGKLKDRFIFPPFSILDARQAIWQRRKRYWKSLGLQGELGRGDNLLNFSSAVMDVQTTEGRKQYRKKLGKSLDKAQSKRKAKRVRESKKDNQYNYVDGLIYKSDSANDPEYYTKKTAVERRLGRKISTKEFQTKYYKGPNAGAYLSGTSIFDPVLSELMYRWFCPEGGHILDPFTGGATRGAVASVLGYDYTGIDVRPEQIEENERQCKLMKVNPNYIVGDSHKLRSLTPKGKSYDMVFTCPPYFDLEVYSESKQDGSSKQSYEEFMNWYEHIFAQAANKLKANRFLVVVVGEIRNKKEGGGYRNFIGDTITCFKNIGLTYYNEMILITATGSLAIRVGYQFDNFRKIGKTHQNVLVFYNGDVQKIPKIFEKYGWRS